MLCVLFLPWKLGSEFLARPYPALGSTVSFLSFEEHHLTGIGLHTLLHLS